MFESLQRETEHSAVRLVPTFGFFALAFEAYAFTAAKIALHGGRYFAPFSVIFFTLDHSEFMFFVVAAICGVDYFLKPTEPRAVIWGLSLVPLALVVLLIIYLALH